MIGVFVVWRILVEIDARQTGEDEWSGVGAKFEFIADFNFADIRERFCEWLEGFDQVVAATKLKFLHRSLSGIENDVGEVVFHFRGMRFDVSQRAEQALFLTGKKNEANRPARTGAAFHDGFGCAKNAGGSGAIVGGAFTEIPGIEMRANDDDFFGMFAANDFSDDIGAFHGAIGEFILHVDANTNIFSGGNETFELALIFHSHIHNRNREILGKTKDSGVRQVHAFGFESTLTTNYGHGAGFMQRVQEITELREDEPEIFVGIALRLHHDDFAAEPFGVFYFGVEIEKISGDHLSFDSRGGSGAGPAHGVHVEFVADGLEKFGVGMAAVPTLPHGPFFGANILQADGFHFRYTPIDG